MASPTLNPHHQAPGRERHRQPDRKPPYATAHPTLDKLWNVILLYPDDVSARLAYADALEEFGNAALGEYTRAAFIRAHIELAAYGTPRKTTTWVDSFSFHRGRGHCYVELPWVSGFNAYRPHQELRVGERIDLVLPDEERDRSYTVETRNELKTLRNQTPYKREWHGVLATSVRRSSMPDPDPGTIRYELEFKVDEQSRPWQGTECLRRCEELFSQGDGRGDNGLPWHSEVTNGYHLQPKLASRLFVSEIWPSTPGGTLQKKEPRWRFVWRNGFPDHVECSTEDWLKYGPGLVLENPVISYASLSNPADTLADNVDWARLTTRLDRWCPTCRGVGTTSALAFGHCARCKGRKQVPATEEEELP